MSKPNKPRISFEFFPPKTEEGKEKLRKQKDQLNTLHPEFYSVTYGAGGSTRDNTKNIVLDFQTSGSQAAPHLSFGSDDEDTILALLKEYQQAGVNRIVALRGDIPSGSGSVKLIYASELVTFIRQHTGDHFHLEVAAYPEIHPEAETYQQDIAYLKQKLDAGANSAITQYFYNADAYFYFVDACQKAGIDKPIYPGVMPIINFENLARFSKNCGADIPRWITKKMLSYGDDKQSVIDFGTEVVTRLCETLLEQQAPGIHFYTMNQAEPTISICNNLKL